MGEQAERMPRLVDDLLSLSRVEMREHLPPADDGRAQRRRLREVSQTLQPLATRGRRHARALARATAPAIVRGDRDELLQVFQNLVQNAIKYGASGGKRRRRHERASRRHGRPGGFVGSTSPTMAPASRRSTCRA